MCPVSHTSPTADALTPENNCIAIQPIKTMNAGNIISLIITTMNSKKSTLAYGNNSKYAPITPEIAPDAPTVGIIEAESDITWNTSAPMPEAK